MPHTCSSCRLQFETAPTIACGPQGEMVFCSDFCLALYKAAVMFIQSHRGHDRDFLRSKFANVAREAFTAASNDTL